LSKRARLIALPVIMVPLLVSVLNYGLFQEPVNKVLERDDRNRGMSVCAHWRWYVDPTVLVYDLQGASGDAKGIDVLRAFLQFAYKQKDRHFGRVELTWRGASRFSIKGGDFAELGRQYVHRSPVDTMAVMPGILYRPDGSKAFPSRPAPFLEQNEQLLLDFTSFISTWVSR
jgi:hypothetical protein